MRMSATTLYGERVDDYANPTLLNEISKILTKDDMLSNEKYKTTICQI